MKNLLVSDSGILSILQNKMTLDGSKEDIDFNDIIPKASILAIVPSFTTMLTSDEIDREVYLIRSLFQSHEDALAESLVESTTDGSAMQRLMNEVGDGMQGLEDVWDFVVRTANERYSVVQKILDVERKTYEKDNVILMGLDNSSNLKKLGIAPAPRSIIARLRAADSLEAFNEATDGNAVVEFLSFMLRRPRMFTEYVFLRLFLNEGSTLHLINSGADANSVLRTMGYDLSNRSATIKKVVSRFPDLVTKIIDYAYGSQEIKTIEQARSVFKS